MTDDCKKGRSLLINLFDKCWEAIMLKAPRLNSPQMLADKFAALQFSESPVESSE